MALALVTITVFAQQVTDTIPIVHTSGQTPLDFLKANAWNLALIVFLLISEWLGSTGKIKEGSIYAWILNMIGKIIRSKTDVVATKKGAFMSLDELDKERSLKGGYKPPKVSSKAPLMILLLIGFGLTASAQGPFDGFFKPMDKTSFEKATLQKGLVKEVNPFIWKFRPSAELTAVQVMYDKETKTWNSSSFHSAGIGLGLQHYVESNGEPVNNYGFNALLMLDATPTEDKGAGFGLAATMNIPNFVNFGGGYNFTFKKPYILLGAVYNF